MNTHAPAHNIRMRNIRFGDFPAADLAPGSCKNASTQTEDHKTEEKKSSQHADSHPATARTHRHSGDPTGKGKCKAAQEVCFECMCGTPVSTLRGVCKSCDEACKADTVNAGFWERWDRRKKSGYDARGCAGEQKADGGELGGRVQECDCATCDPWLWDTLRENERRLSGPSTPLEAERERGSRVLRRSVCPCGGAMITAGHHLRDECAEREDNENRFFDTPAPERRPGTLLDRHFGRRDHPVEMGPRTTQHRDSAERQSGPAGFVTMQDLGITLRAVNAELKSLKEAYALANKTYATRSKISLEKFREMEDELGVLSERLWVKEEELAVRDREMDAVIEAEGCGGRWGHRAGEDCCSRPGERGGGLDGCPEEEFAETSDAGFRTLLHRSLGVRRPYYPSSGRRKDGRFATGGPNHGIHSRRTRNVEPRFGLTRGGKWVRGMPRFGDDDGISIADSVGSFMHRPSAAE